jgi:hypothetical protein
MPPGVWVCSFVNRPLTICTLVLKEQPPIMPDWAQRQAAGNAATRSLRTADSPSSSVREHELGQIVRLATRGHGQMCAIVAEAGAGKALLEDLSC